MDGEEFINLMDGEIKMVCHTNNSYLCSAGIKRKRLIIIISEGQSPDSRGAWHALVWLTEL
jgi:hypothetical protein